MWKPDLGITSPPALTSRWGTTQVAAGDCRSLRWASWRAKVKRPWPRGSSTNRFAGPAACVFIAVADSNEICEDAQPSSQTIKGPPLRLHQRLRPIEPEEGLQTGKTILGLCRRLLVSRNPPSAVPALPAAEDSPADGSAGVEDVEVPAPATGAFQAAPPFLRCWRCGRRFLRLPGCLFALVHLSPAPLEVRELHALELHLGLCAEKQQAPPLPIAQRLGLT